MINEGSSISPLERNCNGAPSFLRSYFKWDRFLFSLTGESATTPETNKAGAHDTSYIPKE
jgi:hypothetical protein